MQEKEAWEGDGEGAINKNTERMNVPAAYLSFR